MAIGHRMKIVFMPPLMDNGCQERFLDSIQIQKERLLWSTSTAYTIPRERLTSRLAFPIPTWKRRILEDILLGFPWGSSGWESTVQYRGLRFSPWSGNKRHHAVEQLGPCTTITEACVLGNPRTPTGELMNLNKRYWMLQLRSYTAK